MAVHRDPEADRLYIFSQMTRRETLYCLAASAFMVIRVEYTCNISRSHVVYLMLVDKHTGE